MVKAAVDTHSSLLAAAMPRRQTSATAQTLQALPRAEGGRRHKGQGGDVPLCHPLPSREQSCRGRGGTEQQDQSFVFLLPSPNRAELAAALEQRGELRSAGSCPAAGMAPHRAADRRLRPRLSMENHLNGEQSLPLANQPLWPSNQRAISVLQEGLGAMLPTLA